MGNLVQQRFAALVIFLAFALALLAGCSGGRPPQAALEKDQTAQEQPAAQAPAQPPSPGITAQPAVRTIQATITSVADGDTVHVRLDGRDEKVRLIGVNCPEISHPDLDIQEQPYGREAKAYTERCLSGRKV